MTTTVNAPENSSSEHPRLSVVVVGAGAMGRSWIRMLKTSAHAELVGLVDLDLPLAQRTAAEEGVPESVVIGESLLEVIAACGADAVINVTVPRAHRIVNETALRAGIPVLCEKPLAETLPAAIQQVALADVTGGLLMVSQSRRYYNRLTALRAAVRELGDLDTITTDFFHEDHEPGFREEMLHPLLVDMSIHHFDQLRFVSGLEPISVDCSAWNPSWSWFKGFASASAIFELTGGARYVYAGSRATPGLQTSWNGTWHVYGKSGAAFWDGEEELRVDADAATVVTDADESIAGSLAAFAASIRTQRTPENEVRDNIRSLAMVEAAALSAERGQRVVINELLSSAHKEAIVTEKSADVRERLASWSSVDAGLASGHWGVR